MSNAEELAEPVKKKKTKPPHEPTHATRTSVISMARIGIPQSDIALTLHLSPKTLRKHYKHELKTAAIQANTVVGGKLYDKCVKGDTASIIFWAKTRMGFRETINNEVSGKGGGPVEFTKIERVIVKAKN